MNNRAKFDLHHKTPKVFTLNMNILFRLYTFKIDS